VRESRPDPGGGQRRRWKGCSAGEEEIKDSGNEKEGKEAKSERRQQQA
jgi:hypothetical protein